MVAAGLVTGLGDDQNEVVAAGEGGRGAGWGKVIKVIKMITFFFFYRGKEQGERHAPGG